jgi:hypothetical protein
VGEPVQAPAQPLSAKDAALCRATAKDLEDGDPEGAKLRLEKYFKCAHSCRGIIVALGDISPAQSSGHMPSLCCWCC